MWARGLTGQHVKEVLKLMVAGSGNLEYEPGHYLWKWSEPSTRCCTLSRSGLRIRSPIFVSVTALHKPDAHGVENSSIVTGEKSSK